MPPDKPLRIIFIEDIPSDAELARRSLERAGFELSSVRVDTEAAYREALGAMEPDIVISDYAMPAFDGMKALTLTRERDPLLSFIILTGSHNEDTAVTCLKAGANDYVIKEHLTRLPFAVAEALANRTFQREAGISEERFRASEERYRSIFRDSSVVMLIIDAADGAIVEANAAAVAFYGWPAGELVGKKIGDINTLPAAEHLSRIREALDGRRNHFIFRHRLADGGLRDVEAHAGPIVIGGRTFLLSVIHDISERVAAEAERDALARKLSRYVAMSPTVTYSFRIEGGKAVWQWVSENVERILGFTPAEALEPDWWFSRVHSQDRASVLRELAELVRRDSLAREYRFLAKDKRELWLRDELRIIRSPEGGAEVVGTLTDVSAGKAAARELFLKSAALEATANAIIITDREGSILWLNQAFERLSGWSREEVLGRNPRELQKSGEQDRDFYRQLWEIIGSGGVWSGKLVNRRKSGTRYVEEMTITPILDGSGAIANFVAVKSDATAREEARKRLVEMNREKDTLLREVHHRVYNNMQTISSLLHLSAGQVDDLFTRGAFGKLDRRIQSMSIIHEMFYESEDISRIEFSSAIRSIVAGIAEDFPESGRRVRLEIEASEVYLDIEQAIPAGLILAELVANSYAYAFPGEGGGSLRIGLGESPSGRVGLSVADDGAGMPPDWSLAASRSLGMILIDSLSRQLEGEIGFSSPGGRGSSASLSFPLRLHRPGPCPCPEA
jgi:PAS domain S-box-containing protein